MNFQDLEKHGYKILEELGHNLSGGRVTYKATHIPTNETVVIKQFQFLGSTWKETEYEAYEQESQILRRLSHPGIPRYLDNFETEQGFCLVQQYIEAQSLATSRSFKLEKIKKIALNLLRILVYLQSQNPPFIHRDIKPENILVDEDLKAYLIDFGFARQGGGEVTVSSVVKGTMGFMPPEQLFNRELTAASDLYGLGATLVCLLTGVKSNDIGTLIDADYQIHFRHLVPPLQRGWINWLEKMVQPLPKERFSSAKEALAALKPIDVHQLPKVRISQDSLLLKANQWPEKLTETITITNPIPKTVLSGRWEVAPHPSDPPHTPYDHSWISFSPQKFEGNQVACQITVDTAQLLSSVTYQRQLILHSNSSEETKIISLEVETGILPKRQSLNYSSLWFLYIFCCCAGAGLTLLNISWWILFLGLPGVAVVDLLLSSTESGIKKNPFTAIISAVLGSIIAGTICTVFFGRLFLSGQSGIGIRIILVMSGILGGAMLGINRLQEFEKMEDWKTLLGKIILGIIFLPYCITSLTIALLLPGLFLPVADVQQSRGIEPIRSRMIALLTGGVGVVSGIWLVLIIQILQGNVFNHLNLSFAVVWMSAMAIASGGTLFYLWYKQAIAIPKKHNKIFAHYQKSKLKFIQP